jgi:hypothetical protein
MREMRPYPTVGAVTEARRRALYARMMTIPGPDVELEVERAEARTVAEPGLTISERAADALLDEMVCWFGTRINRWFDLRGKAAQRVTVSLHVELDGEDAY